MDYIISQLNSRINFLAEQENSASLRTHLQARFEYVLILLLAYLWNKSLVELDDEDREYVFKSITKPTIGIIISIIRKLDNAKLLRGNKMLAKAIDSYVPLRNEKIGHGYVFEDSEDILCKVLSELFDDAIGSSVSIIMNNIDLIHVESFDSEKYRGISYKAIDSNYQAWVCPKEAESFTIGSLYGHSQDLGYFRLSPFIEISSYGKIIGIFNSIEEKLLGKVKYNKLLDSGHFYKEWDELCGLDIENDGLKLRSVNGTIRNVYQNNYKKYIDIGIKQKLGQFLEKSMASVCATVWGHGGVGKTATVQSICEDLSNATTKTFDYILFFSAKDRKYNYYTGRIEDIDDRIKSFEHLMATINLIMFDEPNSDPSRIISYKGKLMLIIDDFETFVADEKEKIKDFVLQLNTNFHKVVITTRANIVIGQEFKTNELTRDETKDFLIQILENEEIPHLEIVKREIENEDKMDKVFEITSGRPLFIFQLAFIIGQTGIQNALSYNIAESTNAINFLYGRIYDNYLSNNAKDLFVVLSLLVNQDILGNVIQKAQYVLNQEGDNDKFMSAVNELVKLKIIKLNDENTLFEIYSKEIYQIMCNYFEKKNPTFKRTCIQRSNQVNRERSLGIEESLLNTANANRLMKNEIEVVEGYKQILNRATSSMGIKLSAILNMSAYLIDRGKRDEALRYLDEQSHHFAGINSNSAEDRIIYSTFTKMNATYNWANGTKEQKDKAIDILLSYASRGFNYSQNIDLEIAGLLLQYRSIALVTDWQELKEKHKYGEVSLNQFRNQREKQIQLCKDIHDKQGVFIFNKVSLLKMEDFSSGARQNIISGLYSFLEILIRLQKFETAQKICEYVLYCAPKNFHPQFLKKSEWINYVLYNNQKKRDVKGSRTT